jgi:hypothetical protein
MKFYQIIQTVKNYYGNADAVWYLIGIKYEKIKVTSNAGSGALYKKEDVELEYIKLKELCPNSNFNIIEANPEVIHDLRCLAL